MYSWNTIRTTFAILLLIPLLHLAFLASQDVAAKLNNSPTTWEDEVAAYTRDYQSRQLPVDPIIVVGGRRVKLWQGLEDILSPRPVLMLGVGDATIDDIIHYHAQLVGYFQPSAVVIFPGNSEFHVRDNKTALELATSIQQLIELDKSYGVERHYYVLPPIKSPLYPEDYAKIDEVGQLLESWATGQPLVRVLDANALLAQGNGSPNPDYFRMDGSSLNEHGYLRVSVLLQDRLEREEPEPPVLDNSR